MIYTAKTIITKKKKKSSKEFTGTNVYAIIAVSKLFGSSWKSIKSIQTHL